MKILQKTAIALNLLIATALLLGMIARCVDPRNAVVFAFFGLAYPYFIWLNLLCITLWLPFKKKYALISAAASLFWIADLPKIFGFHKMDTCIKMEDSIKVLSWNVRLFDLYNWSHNRDTRDKMLEFIRKENADVLCLQEFFNSDRKGYFTTLDTLLQIQDADHTHIAYTKTVKGVFHFGLAIFSRYPIVNKGRVRNDGKPLSSSNDCIYADIVKGKDTLRIYNMHLASIRFDRKAYDFMEHFGEVKGNERLQGISFIASHLALAFKERAAQLDIVLDHIRRCPYPIVACADLNDSPTSNAYHRLSDNLQDAFVQSGSGTGTTYHGHFPGYRIDYIYCSEELKTSCFNTIQN
ncbi:MAG: endonuclease/exonuclease/phosphatase family protein, partial [Flavobacteriales bacterium]